MIIGDDADPHVAAVVQACKQLGSAPVVCDAVSLARQQWEWRDGEFRLDGAELQGRGWIRRLHPADWQTGTLIGSREAAEATAWLQLLAGAVRSADVRWLTPLDVVVAAESKVLQDAVAHRAGVRVPQTVVATSAPDGECVVKPIGPGHFVDADGTPWAVPTSRVTSALRAAAPTAPFLFQEALVAQRHLRVVTVGDRAWCAALDAEGRPLDWRSDDATHIAFRAVTDADAARAGLEMATAMQVGYSSQDWIETFDDLFFLDLNPSGQWLFLPEPIGGEVTTALADWLSKRA